MITNNTPKIMITSTNSGGGKTTVTCGIMQALMDRGVGISSFKCGPDYIDPLFHSKIIGSNSINLDLFFMQPDLLKQTFDKYARTSQVAIIEGVMGYYDGLGGTTSTASAYDVACVLDTSTVLIVDAKGASYSIIATILGFINMYENTQIKGVILNRCSKMLYSMIAPVIEEKCGVMVLGFLPYDSEFSIESRHLGLVTAGEIVDLNEKVQKIATAVEENINLDLMIKLASESDAISYEKSFIENRIFPNLEKNSTIAVAYDKAFCFYYNETFEMFKELGFELEYFSPLKDEGIPKKAKALYIGGGYPELYLNELEENILIKESIRRAILDNNIITLAECGGFMYLGNSIENREMVGIIDANFYNKKKLTRFGYINLKATSDSIIAQKDEVLKGHEFHYYDSDNNGESFTATKPVGSRSWKAIHTNENLIAGYPHLYLPANVYTRR